MDTDNFCDGQGAKCETKRVRTFLHTNRARSGTNVTAASEGTHLQKQVKIRLSQKLRPRNLRPPRDLRVYNACGTDCKRLNSYRFLFYGHAMFNQR